MGAVGLRMRKQIRPKDVPIVIKEGKFMRLIREGGWEYVQRNNCTGIVVVAAMTNDQKVILLKQYRPPVKKYCIELVAGLVNDQGKKTKESMATAARRELWEEAGYKAETMTKILTGPVSPGSSADCMTLFLAQGLTKDHDGGGDHTEEIEVFAIPMGEVETWLKKMEQRGCLVDPKVYTGLHFLRVKA
jgi:ADP-ribose pyrophosphatase